MNFNEKIKSMRETAGMTQASLGEKLGVSEKVISKWENGDTKPSIEVLPAIADAFGVNIDDLFGHVHNSTSDIKQNVYEYFHNIPRENVLDAMQMIISYMILGSSVRYNEEGGWYTPEELKDEWRELIENYDKRPQVYWQEHSTVCKGSIRNICNDEFKFVVLQNYPGNTFLNILSQYELYKGVFEFLSMPDAYKILRFYYSGEMPETYTLDFAVKKSGAPLVTVEAYQKLTGTSEYYETAIIGGNEVKLFHRKLNDYDILLQTVISAAFGISKNWDGHR